MDSIFLDIFIVIFRKLGMLTRYVFYFIIGQKRTLKYLDRRQTEPVEFTQRGINVVVGLAMFILIAFVIIKILDSLH